MHPEEMKVHMANSGNLKGTSVQILQKLQVILEGIVNTSMTTKFQFRWHGESSRMYLIQTDKRRSSRSSVLKKMTVIN